jgi:hypothetical protein
MLKSLGRSQRVAWATRELESLPAESVVKTVLSSEILYGIKFLLYI